MADSINQTKVVAIDTPQLGKGRLVKNKLMLYSVLVANKSQQMALAKIETRYCWLRRKSTLYLHYHALVPIYIRYYCDKLLINYYYDYGICFEYGFWNLLSDLEFLAKRKFAFALSSGIVLECEFRFVSYLCYYNNN